MKIILKEKGIQIKFKRCITKHNQLSYTYIAHRNTERAHYLVITYYPVYLCAINTAEDRQS